MEKIGFKIDDCRTYTINEILERVSKPVNVERDKEYSQIGIRSFGKGLFYKESVTGEELGNKSVFWIEPDCFILNIVFAWEQAIGKTTQKELGMIASHRFPMYRPNLSKVDLDYLIYFFLTKTGKEILELSSPGGAGRNKTLGQDIFLNSSITLPPLSVQKLNGLILAKIDSLIQAKTQKLESLKSVKKSLLQKCFPKDGEKVPQMRFEGFSGDWEEKNVEECCKTIGFKKYLKEPIVNGTYEVIQQGDEPILGYADGKPFDNYNSVIIFGDHTLSLYKPDKPFFVATDGVRILKTDFMERDFFYYVLQRYMPLSEGYKRYFSILNEKTIYFPLSKSEQQKIGQFFSKYDSLISLQQKEIDNLKTIKKSFLQKMFV